MQDASPDAAPAVESGTSPPALLRIRDLRDPSQPMATFNMRLPAGLIDEISQAAAQHNTRPRTLARELLARGLDQLKANASS